MPKKLIVKQDVEVADQPPTLVVAPPSAATSFTALAHAARAATGLISSMNGAVTRACAAWFSSDES